MDKNCKIVIAFLLGILAYYFLFKKDLVEGACIGGDNCGEITGHAECVEQSGCRLEGTTIEGENTIISSTIPTADLPGIIRSIESSGYGGLSGLPSTGMGSSSTSIPSNPGLRSQIETLNRQQMNELTIEIFTTLREVARQAKTDEEGFTNLVEGLSNQQIEQIDSILDYLENVEERIDANDYDPQMLNSLRVLISLLETERFNEEFNIYLAEHPEIRVDLQPFFGDNINADLFIIFLNEIISYNEENPESEEVGLRCLDDPDYMEDRYLTCKQAYGNSTDTIAGTSDSSDQEKRQYYSLNAPSLDSEEITNLRNTDRNMLTTSMGVIPGSDPPEPIFPNLNEINTPSYRICSNNKRFIAGRDSRRCSEQICCEDIPLEEREVYTQNRVTYPINTKIIFCHNHEEWRNIMNFLVENYDRNNEESNEIPSDDTITRFNNRIAFATTNQETYSSSDTGIEEESMKMKFAQSIEEIYNSIKNHQHLKNLTDSEKREVGFDVTNLPPFNINDITNVAICNENPTTTDTNSVNENRNQCEIFHSFNQCSG